MLGKKWGKVGIIGSVSVICLIISKFQSHHPSASDAEMLNSICIKFCLCLFFCTDAANNENVHTYASAFNLQKVLQTF